MKFTQANVEKARVPAGKSEPFFSDDEMPGFGLRLRKAGRDILLSNTRSGPSTAA